MIARPTSLPEVEVWEREQWQEKPITIEAMQSYAGLNNGTRGMAVMTGVYVSMRLLASKWIPLP